MAPIAHGTRKTAQFSPLTFFYRLPGLMFLSLKRQRSHVGLTLLALTGIILAVSLVTNATFFAQAVDRVILMQELGDFSQVTGRPPFSTSAYIFPSRRAPLRLQEAERISRNIAATLSGEVGLPVQYQGLQVSSGGMMLQPGSQSQQDRKSGV